MIKTYHLNQSPFYNLKRKSKLAAILRVTESDMRRLARHADEMYSEFNVTKKSGGLRLVENPRRELKLVQARIARLLGRIEAPDHLFCPVKGKCYVGNAFRHRGNRVIRCLDVRKYFPSTSSKRVYWFFQSVMGCSKDVAAILARIATYNKHLPTGSPLSPIMAYYAHYDVWSRIAKICKENDYRLTVYVDDVTISGKHLDPRVIWEVKREIHRSGLRYHKEKKYVDVPAEITGVIVKGEEISLPNRQLKKLSNTRSALKRPIPKIVEEKLRERMAGLSGQIAHIRRFHGKS